MTTFSGSYAEMDQAISDAIKRAAVNFGTQDVDAYLEEVPKTSLAVELSQALRDLGYEVNKIVSEEEYWKHYNEFVEMIKRSEI